VPKKRRNILILAAVVAVALVIVLLTRDRLGPVDYSGPTADWLDYGNSRGGDRYSPLTQITPENVRHLEVAWVYHTGDVSDGRGEVRSTTAFEATPIVVDGTLYVCSPLNRVIALDPETGSERWSYDPQVNLEGGYANQLVCRGVTTWLDSELEDGTCRRRIYTATNDARLVALDAATGAPCEDFGEDGQVDLNLGVGEQWWLGEYQVTSPPAVAGDVVIVGSAVGDNQRTDAPSGVVRAYDARNGELIWAWDLAPPFEVAGAEFAAETGYMLSTPNVWAPFAVDEERDLVFLPTGNPTPDYYGGHRNGIDYYGSALIAVRASTGEVLWHFQTVHHDLWDFDVPAQPTLTTITRGGVEVPIVSQATKMGVMFRFHRETGEPIFEIEERPVPQSTVPGEQTSPTQPFPVKPPPLVPHELSPEDAWGLTPFDKKVCKEKLASLYFEGVYTPPQLGQSTLMYPGNAGGSNWGGVAVDPVRQLLVANVMDMAWVVSLLPIDEFEDARRANPGVEISPQRGTPYAMRREMLMSDWDLPCNPPPWGTLSAIDLGTGAIRWQVKLGTIRDVAPVPVPWKLGVPNLGGPLVTASGLIFIGATMDDYIRAFDIETGKELWKGRLPAGGQATPMTYRLSRDGKQYVVIAAGGHGRAGTTLGDAIVAYALPDVD
jgi:quinoprotein glucose dehydrogenase